MPLFVDLNNPEVPMSPPMSIVLPPLFISTAIITPDGEPDTVDIPEKFDTLLS